MSLELTESSPVIQRKVLAVQVLVPVGHWGPCQAHAVLEQRHHLAPACLLHQHLPTCALVGPLTLAALDPHAGGRLHPSHFVIYNHVEGNRQPSLQVELVQCFGQPVKLFVVAQVHIRLSKQVSLSLLLGASDNTEAQVVGVTPLQSLTTPHRLDHSQWSEHQGFAYLSCSHPVHD